jgi:hypothetical protein
MSPMLTLPDDYEEALQSLHDRGLTDGLPVVLPTAERVARMVAAQPRPADDVVGLVAPRNGEATVEALACNAVMAGCRPEHFPVVLAAVEACLDPDFNLLGVQATTHNCTVLVLVNGPIRRALGFATGHNAMGEGHVANAVVGRALRLILRNVGGASPGTNDMTVHGSPARFSFVVAEDEEGSPFPPLHTARGFQAEQSVVTVVAAEGPHNLNDHCSSDATNVLEMLAGGMVTTTTNDLGRGGSPVLVLGPEHAAMLAAEGHTRSSVQRWLFDRARLPLDRMPRDLRAMFVNRADIDRSVWSERGVPLAARAEDILVLVTGGAGRHSSYVPSFAYSVPISRAVAAAIACDC